MALAIGTEERDVMTGSSGMDWSYADLTESEIPDLHHDESADMLDSVLADS